MRLPAIQISIIFPLHLPTTGIAVLNVYINSTNITGENSDVTISLQCWYIVS